MSFLNSLSNKVLNDKYFNKLLLKLERINSFRLFRIRIDDILTNKEYYDLLRFADILTYSDDVKLKNTAYKVISLLADDIQEEQVFFTFATAMLSKLGNFPALKFIRNTFSEEVSLPLEKRIEKDLKEKIQKVPDSNTIFTDSQFFLFEKLKNSNHFSFSGPTSFGKSFIIEEFIRHILNKNEDVNIVVLVPTRALINQVSIGLKKKIKKENDYKILTHPVVPEFIRHKHNNYIFVFTPERLIAYFSEIDNPKISYLFIDEAHKIISDNDSRCPIYYQAVLQAERKSVHLFFSSPNIPNPEIFLQLFEKSTDERMSIADAVVAQNRYFLDLINRNCFCISEQNENIKIPLNMKNNDFNYWLKRIGENEKNIIYCNTVDDTISYAINFANDFPDKRSVQIDNVISIIKHHLHKDYYLIDCLKKGIAFHFGKLPQLITQLSHI